MKGNPFFGTMRGKLGEQVFYRSLGEQKARTYVKEFVNRRSSLQMNQRTQLANLVNLYRTAAEFIKGAFSDKKTEQSDYNAFVSRNLNTVKVYLPKEMAKAQGCVVAPYQISSGSLPQVQVTGNGIDAVTNIFIASDFVIDDNTTIADLSAALVAANGSLSYGMQISYISLVQTNNVQTGYPTVACNLFKIILDETDTRKVRDYMPAYALTNVNGKIGHGDSYASGAFAWIVSGKDANGKVNVSSQRLIVTSEDLYNSYSSASAVTKATRSYGSEDTTYVTPDGTYNRVEVSGYSISSVSIGGTVMQNGYSNSIDIAANAAFSLVGTNLVSGSIKIALMTSRNNTTAQLVAAAQELSSVVTITSDSSTNISGTFAAAHAGIQQIAILVLSSVELNINSTASSGEGGIEGI